MTRQTAYRFVGAAVVIAIPVALVAAFTAGLAAADTQPPPLPAISTSPASTSVGGRSGAEVGLPGGNGGSVSAQPCTAPCTSSGSLSHGSQPAGVGVQTGHSAAGSGDDAQAAAAGAPYGAGQAIAGETGSSFVGPSGGSYSASGCVSVLSQVPGPLPLNGVGFSCPNPGTNGGGTPSGASGSPVPDGGSAGTGSPSVNAGGGSSGSAGSVCAAPVAAPVAAQSVAARPAAAATQPPAPSSQLMVLAVFAALACGYTLARLRRPAYSP